MAVPGSPHLWRGFGAPGHLPGRDVSHVHSPRSRCPRGPDVETLPTETRFEDSLMPPSLPGLDSTSSDDEGGLGDGLRAAADRLSDRVADALPAGGGGAFALNTALSAAITTAAGTALRRWARSHRPGVGRLVRGAAAGAGAAGVALILRQLLSDGSEDGPDVGDVLLRGAGRGVVYTAVLDPILPGPAPLRGALAGLLEYLLAPHGGLMSRLAGLTPVERIPVVGTLVKAGDDAEDPFTSFLLYGVALGLLTGEADR